MRLTICLTALAPFAGFIPALAAPFKTAIQELAARNDFSDPVIRDVMDLHARGAEPENTVVPGGPPGPGGGWQQAAAPKGNPASAAPPPAPPGMEWAKPAESPEEDKPYESTHVKSDPVYIPGKRPRSPFKLGYKPSEEMDGIHSTVSRFQKPR
ncbi:hypothetical protein EIP91_008627 [Steccherinum ochraceum]|uniref:Uncharacterized protein n=1 Tax=Steccherinum ochraceum TaxID=92696 RepID=A0A4R0RKD9_9APHY|nr:hypothetical protein EIP91_008627 [Steccherinum ochraceum]